MTNEEAIKKLDLIKGNYIQWMGMPDDRCEALDLAISALEKQIPKKAMDYKCPTCGDEFCTEMWEVDYCCSCGQRLKWGDENDRAD